MYNNYNQKIINSNKNKKHIKNKYKHSKITINNNWRSSIQHKHKLNQDFNKHKIHSNLNNNNLNSSNNNLNYSKID